MDGWASIVGFSKVIIDKREYTYVIIIGYVQLVQVTV